MHFAKTKKVENQLGQVNVVARATTAGVRLNKVMDGSFGLYTWPAAVVLAQYIFYNKEKIKGKKILEIGCGTALCGIVAAKCNAQVLLTDSTLNSKCLENCHRNCSMNNIIVDKDIQIEELVWGNFTERMMELQGTFDVILGSDCFYDAKDFEDILAMISFLMQNNPQTEFWCSYQLRSSEWSIEKLLHKWALSAEIIPLSSFEADSDSIADSNMPGNHTISMFIIKAK